MSNNNDTVAGSTSPDQDPTQQDLFTSQDGPEFTDAMLPALARRYPYMFTPDNIGLAMQAGWYPVFETLCIRIDGLLGANKRDFHWRQLKEKFASARWYWRMDGKSDTMVDVLTVDGPVGFRIPADPEDSLRQAIAAEVTQAQTKTASMCMACGAPAHCTEVGSYLVTLCETHLAMRRTDPKALDRTIQGGEANHA